METNNKPSPEKRNFTDLEDRLNDREARVPEEEDTMDREEFLDRYPREAINDEVVSETKVKAVRQRVIGEINEEQNEAVIDTAARQQMEQEDYEDRAVKNRGGTAPRDADRKAASK